MLYFSVKQVVKCDVLYSGGPYFVWQLLFVPPHRHIYISWFVILLEPKKIHSFLHRWC